MNLEGSVIGNRYEVIEKIGISIGSFVFVFNTILYIICGIVIKS